jgi:hypothetical protein
MAEPISGESVVAVASGTWIASLNSKSFGMAD